MKGLFKELEDQIKDCSVCGTDPDDWKECGCQQDGFNEGIKKAIEIIERKIKENTEDCKESKVYKKK